MTDSPAGNALLPNGMTDTVIPTSAVDERSRLMEERQTEILTLLQRMEVSNPPRAGNAIPGAAPEHIPRRGASRPEDHPTEDLFDELSSMHVDRIPEPQANTQPDPLPMEVEAQGHHKLTRQEIRGMIEEEYKSPVIFERTKMEGGRDQSTFWNFSDQLRLHTAGISSLSLTDSIWSDPHLSTTGRRMEDRRNTDVGVSPDSAWKAGFDLPQKLAFSNNNNNLTRYNSSNLGGASTLKNTKDANNGSRVNDFNVEFKNYLSKAISNPKMMNSSSGLLGGVRKNNENIVKGGKNKKNSNNVNKDSNTTNNNGSSVDKRFKTLPPSEALPRTEPVGVTSSIASQIQRLRPGNNTRAAYLLAASFGGANIDPAAWEDKKHPGESRFPAQIKVVTRKNCVPLEEDSFRPILHHYDGPKFRLELSVPEALALLDVFAE
ncbi:hypothetical protein KSP40_PGU014735 [Platanthera guangdongensis]|uniref:DCD domain-containing protein n=1 Tax=Platanthera guangdongensis TaxID=2320717 RepID=A0ABR2MV82_9ASPA